MGQLLREFTHGHTRQLASVAREHLVGLAERTGCLAGIEARCFIDIDSLLRPVYGHAKQGASFGHTKIASRQVLRKGLSPLATTISTERAAPMVAGIRLRAGAATLGLTTTGSIGWSTRQHRTGVAANFCPPSRAWTWTRSRRS